MSECVKEKSVSERLIHNMKEKKYEPNFFRKELNKNETLAQVVSCKFCETFKNTFFIEHVRRLLLSPVGVLKKNSFINENTQTTLEN